MEVWAAIDLLGGRAVTLVQGDPSRRTVWREEPLELAARWENEGARGLHVVDLDGAFESGSNQKIIERIVKRSKILVEVGGGVRNREKAERLLGMGADRVVLGTLAYKDPAALEMLLRKIGSGKIVVATDYKNGKVVSGGWKDSEGVSVMDAINRFESLGVDNILATAVGLDGTGEGPDVTTTRKICASTRMRVLASGGIRSKRDMEALEEAGAHGVVLGRALYEETIKLGEVNV
ncbi:MAG: 1-(5-phosphoribosyl)-5-[(5-phosphoribosylamino)methylideneamino]imidazole-4-carboxamide isomerase [Thaumarchaeota archaeon]|nr:1-(5-phosphoribosyl)-5-[(5-phosphoribosylamino)methylideneamino]imidazole-4-carboxamide isomerase [Nitrososphaerota archaeon]